MEKMNLYQKVILARRRFAESSVKKTGLNQYSGFKYFELSDIIPVALQICGEVGICPVVSFDNEKAVMTVYDTDSTQSFTITSPFTESPAKGMSPIQATGAVETYSRRYLWLSLLEIVENDYFDSMQGKDNGKPLKAKTDKTARIEDMETMQKRIWASLLKYFGFIPGLKKEEVDDVRMEAKKFLNEKYGIKDASGITPEIAEDITKNISREAV